MYCLNLCSICFLQKFSDVWNTEKELMESKVFLQNSTLPLFQSQHVQKNFPCFKQSLLFVSSGHAYRQWCMNPKTRLCLWKIRSFFITNCTQSIKKHKSQLMISSIKKCSIFGEFPSLKQKMKKEHKCDVIGVSKTVC